MKFYRYLTEDYEAVRDYKKAVFDLKVALGELEFYMGEKVPNDDPLKRQSHLQKGVSLKQKIIGLKEKINKMITDLGESVDVPKELKDTLDKIPDKDSDEFKKLEYQKQKIGGRG